MNYSFMGPNDPNSVTFTEHGQKADEKIATIQSKVKGSTNPSTINNSSAGNPFLEKSAGKETVEPKEPAIDLEKFIGDKRAEKILASPDVVLSKKKIRKKMSPNSKGILDKLGGFTARETNNEKVELDKNIIPLTSRADVIVHDRNSNNNQQVSKLKIEEEIPENGIYNSPRSNGMCCNKNASCQCSIF